MKEGNVMSGSIKLLESYEIINTQIYSDNSINQDFMVTFRVTDSCNIKCDYCHWNSGPQYKTKDIMATIDKLFEFFEKCKFKTIVFYFHGGEPSTHPDIIEILKYIKHKSMTYNMNSIIEFQTNLVHNIMEILPHIELLDISFHFKELSSKNKLQIFLDNFKTLVEQEYVINNFDVMLENIEDPVQLEYFHSLILDFLNYKNIMNSEMIYGFCHYEYNEETRKKHLDFYNKHNKVEQLYKVDGKTYNTNELFQNGMDCVGSTCDAGKKSITVNGNGDTFHCGIHMTNYLRNCMKEKPFTNLITDKMVIPKLNILNKTGTKCRWNYCGGDFYLQKTIGEK